MSREAKRAVLRELGRNAAAILFVAFLGVLLFFLCGGSIDGLLYGHWPPVADHPTNAGDAAPDS
jgi:hypothetical protein